MGVVGLHGTMGCRQGNATGFNGIPGSGHKVETQILVIGLKLVKYCIDRIIIRGGYLCSPLDKCVIVVIQIKGDFQNITLHDKISGG